MKAEYRALSKLTNFVPASTPFGRNFVQCFVSALCLLPGALRYDLVIALLNRDPSGLQCLTAFRRASTLITDG